MFDSDHLLFIAQSYLSLVDTTSPCHVNFFFNCPKFSKNNNFTELTQSFSYCCATGSCNYLFTSSEVFSGSRNKSHRITVGRKLFFSMESCSIHIF